MPRRAHPDFALEAGRGTSPSLSATRAALVSRADFDDREADRAGARDLDRAVERMTGLNRQQRDRERAMPRDATGQIGHPLMERRLPAPGTLRRSLSSRQRKARSAIKQGVQDRLPAAQYRALSRLVTDPGYRARIGDALSAAAGDVQQLPDTQRAAVQRQDRAIRAYERDCRRGHVVYVNLELPEPLQGGHPLGTVRAHWPEGTVISLDRFTGGAHTMHEVEPPGGGGQSMPVLEIQTRRGMYLGRSDSMDDTTHLLPRGMRLQVTGMEEEAAYERPDGTIGRRPVIQLRDAGS